MSETADVVLVTDAPEDGRFEARIQDQLVGIAEYRLDGDLIVFTHTEVADEAEGKGVGGRLVGEALEQVRSRGLRVVARCPFVRSYIERHPEHQDLLAPT